ncbi:MAG TPA: hypothetical protein VGM80_08940, partial [Gaiellaceae bacterium]
APSRRAQLGFVAFAGLATFTRVQYVVLVPAFVVAAIVLDRRSAFRTHRLPLALFAAVTAGATALGPSRILGYYSRVGHLHLHAGLLRWAGLDVFFLALAGGVVLVPGGIAGILCARERHERAFAALVSAFAFAVMAEAALYASNGSNQFKERYLFTLLPLVPIAFGVYLRRGLPARWLVTAVSGAVAVLAVALPLTHYANGFGFDDSPLLWCVTELRWQLGSTGASLVISLCSVGAAGLAAAVAWSRLERLAVPLSLALVAGLSLGATVFDIDYASGVRKQLVAGDPSWIDGADVGPVTAVETELAPTAALSEQLFWNPSIVHEALLGNPAPTDAFAAGTLGVADDGSLAVDGVPLHTALLFQGFELTPVLENMAPAGRFGSLSLWRPTGAPRLRALELGRYWDGWLSPQGGLEVWPGAAGGTLSFTLSLPAGSPGPVTVAFGSHVFRISPGTHADVRVPIAGPKPWSVRFRAVSGASVLPDRRPVGLRSTVPVFAPARTAR